MKHVLYIFVICLMIICFGGIVANMRADIITLQQDLEYTRFQVQDLQEAVFE